MEAQEKNALHLATHSGWYRFEWRGENWEQADRALTYWQMSCIQVDPDNSKRVYIGTEHSGGNRHLQHSQSHGQCGYRLCGHLWNFDLQSR